MKEPSTLQKFGLALWNFLCLLGRAVSAVLKWTADRREFTIWPVVIVGILLVFAFGIFVVTGYKLLNDVGSLGTAIIAILKVAGVFALFGAAKTKGYLLSDIRDENDPATPWQKVVGSDFAFVLGVCFVSWLVLSN